MAKESEDLSQSELLPYYLGCDMSSVWHFWAHFLDVILPGNHHHCKMSAVFLGYHVQWMKKVYLFHAQLSHWHQEKEKVDRDN